jgi:hypothetical protein
MTRDLRFTPFARVVRTPSVVVRRSAAGNPLTKVVLILVRFCFDPWPVPMVFV